MTRNEILDVDIERLHQQVDAVLSSEDSLIVVVDGKRAISYSHGFGLSACQLELLAADIERLIRDVVGGPTANAVDEVLVESFPASDPPSWNPGMARPRPRRRDRRDDAVSA